MHSFILFIPVAFIAYFYLSFIGINKVSLLSIYQSIEGSSIPAISLAILLCIDLIIASKKSSRFMKKGFNRSALLALTWQDFEKMTAEYFAQKGYRAEVVGGGGSDGGIDVVLKKDGKSYIVQCKHWKTKKVGVQIVREMYGLMHAHHAYGVKIVSTIGYSKQAIDFAHKKPIELITGEQVIQEQQH